MSRARALGLCAKAAIEHLGSGLLRHPSNDELVRALRSGELGPRALHRQLLRLVFRLIVLFVAEDRGLLHPPWRDDVQDDSRARRRLARATYDRDYASIRVKALAPRAGRTSDAGLWRRLRVVLDALHRGCPELDLTPIGSSLFDPNTTPALVDVSLSEEDLSAALRALCTFVDDTGTRGLLCWRELGGEELGAAFEALLELHPVVEHEAGRYHLEGAAGHDRKTTGSYYTPAPLVDCLLDSALEPVLARVCSASDPERAVLALKVCDPACGSGHLLLAAGGRIARRLAQLRAGARAPTPEDDRRALRDVYARCLFGVDLNPLAVELCKVSLWLEAPDLGRSLARLDAHIVQGNALIGATPSLLSCGVPDAAFAPIEGDERAVAKRLRLRNRSERERSELEARDAATSSHERRPPADARADQLVADTWCAAFLWPKDDEHEAAAPTSRRLAELRAAPTSLPTATRRIVAALAKTHRFVHWHLAFPQVFTIEEGGADDDDEARSGWRGGFDVILANPPWERIKLQEKEYFAARSAAVERGVAPAERRRRIAALARDDPATYQAYLRALRASSGVLRFLRASGRYPLTAHGDINTYSIFAELARALLTEDGLAGLIVPTGIATDDTNKRFFRRLMGEGSLVSLFDFENRDALFPGVDTRMRFCLLTFGRARQQAAPVFSFFARDVRDLRDEQRSFTLTADDIRAMNPIRQTCPVFRTRRDARVAAALCRAAPPLRAPGERAGAGASRWPVQITTIFHMTHDSSLFRPRPAGADWRPVLEGKMIGMYDHRAADIIVNPRNLHRPQQPQAVRGAQRLSPAFTPRPYLWAPSSVVEGRRPSGWSRAWALVVKRVSAATNERTVVGAFVPMHALSYTLYVITAPAPAGDFVGLAANLLSYVYDYCVRQKTTQSSITIGVLREAPIIPRDRYEQSVAWGPAGLSLIDWIRPRVLELSYTAWDLVAFARDQGYEGPPFRWDDERRFWLRAELDAAYFHLYGLHEDDVAHVMDSFELARKRDQRAHGVYRTKAAILDIYRRMAKAAATGEPYEAAIDPAPADPRAAHPARSAEEVAGVAATLHRALVERDVADARDESSARARGRRRSSDRSSASGDRGSDAAPPSGPDRTAPPGGD